MAKHNLFSEELMRGSTGWLGENGQGAKQRKEREIGKSILHDQKNVWAFFCHMDYVKE